MKVIVDIDICQGYGNCLMVAPDFFDLDDSGKVRLLKATVETADERAAALAAIPQCPMSAIQLGEET